MTTLSLVVLGVIFGLAFPSGHIVRFAVCLACVFAMSFVIK
jgi:hypothetical protein